MSQNSTYVFLTVRMNSTRLPNKCLLPFGDTNLLGHAIARSKYAGFTPVVCTSNDQSDNDIESFCVAKGEFIFRGSLNNKLLRWHDCAQNFEISKFHTIDVDDPFFDPKQIIQSMDLLTNENLDIIHPTTISSQGSASVGYSIRFGALEKVHKYFSSINFIEMVDIALNNLKILKQKKLTTEALDYPNVRLTVDYPEDYALMKFILQELGPNCNREEIFSLFSRNPDLYKFNWHRNKEWIDKQNQLRADFQAQNA